MVKKTILELIINILKIDKFQLSFNEILDLLSDDYPNPTSAQMSSIYRAFRTGIENSYIEQILTKNEKRKYVGHYYRLGSIDYIK